MSHPGDEESESAAARSAGEISRTYRVWIARDAITDRYVVPIEADPTAVGRYRCCACDCPLLVRPCSVGGQHFAHRRGEGRLCRGPSAAHRQAVAFVVHWLDQHLRGVRSLTLDLVCDGCDVTRNILGEFPAQSLVVLTADAAVASPYDVEVRSASGASLLGVRVWWADRSAWLSPAPGVPWIRLAADVILEQVLRDQAVQTPALALWSHVGAVSGSDAGTEGVWCCPSCCEADREQALRAQAAEAAPRIALQGAGTGQMSAVRRVADRLRQVHLGRGEPMIIATSVACPTCRQAKTITLTPDLFHEVVTPTVNGSTFAWDIELRRGGAGSSELVLGVLVVNGGRPTWLRDPERIPSGPGRFICLDQHTIDHVVPMSVLENGITYPSRCGNCLELAAAAAEQEETLASQGRCHRALAALKALKHHVKSVVLPGAQRDLDDTDGAITLALDEYRTLHEEFAAAVTALTQTDRQALTDKGGVSAEIFSEFHGWSLQRITEDARTARSVALRARSHGVKTTELKAVLGALFQRDLAFRNSLPALTSQAAFKLACHQAAADTEEDLRTMRGLIGEIQRLGEVPLLGAPDTEQPVVPVKKWLDHFTPQTEPAWWDCEHAQAMDLVLLKHHFDMTQVLRLAQRARAEASTEEYQAAAEARVQALIGQGLAAALGSWKTFVTDLQDRSEGDESWDTLANPHKQKVDALLQVIPADRRPAWVTGALDALHAGPFRMSTQDKKIRLLQIDQERLAGRSGEL